MRKYSHLLILLIPSLALCDGMDQDGSNIVTYDDIHWCVADTPEENFQSIPLTTSASRVTFWGDVVERGKIVLVGTLGGALTSAGIDLLNQGQGDVVVYSSVGLVSGIAWSLAARWGDKTEKLGWRTFMKPVAILGVSVIVSSFILQKKKGPSLVALVAYLFGEAFILGRMYGKREPATQAVRVRPDRVSFNLMTLFDDADDM